MHLIILQKLAFNALWINIRNVLQNHSFLFIDATLASDNILRFRKNLSEIIQKLIIPNDDQIEDEKMQYDINREAVKISASGKIDNYEFLDQRRVTEQISLNIPH